MSTNHLADFEARSRQKTSDLFDYMELIAAINNNEKLTGHTFRMIEKLFLSDTCQVYALDVPTNNSTIASIIEAQAIPTWFQPNGKALQQDASNIALRPTADGGYTGILHFYLNPADEEGTPEAHTVEIHVQRTTKRFGKETRKVWEVYLCDVDAPWNQE